jgi:hypothetical protein
VVGRQALNPAASAAPPRSLSWSACSLTGTPERAGGLEHAAHLRGGEADAFAERVDRVDQPSACRAASQSQQAST